MKHVIQDRNYGVRRAVVATAIVAGCANAPLRTEASTSGIRAAEEAGAAKVPQASLHLQLARRTGTRQGLAAKGEKEKAASMLLRAEPTPSWLSCCPTGCRESEAMAAVERVRQLRQDNQ